MAATVVAMPRLGMTMEAGVIVEWPLELGAPVSRGQTVLVIETEKTQAEVEATADGFFRHIYIEPGETVACGTLCGAICDTLDEPFDADAFAARHPGPEAAPSPVARARDDEEAGAGLANPAAATAAATTAAPRDRTHGSPGGGQPTRRPIAPAARALARKLGLDVEAVPGSGPGGRVTKQDVEAFASAREGLISVEPGVALEVLREGPSEAAEDHGPVVMLPGFGSDVSAFAPQAAELVRDHEVIGVNPRGVGLSDAPDVERYDVARAAADVAALLDGPAHIVGASLGAAVAIELALARPDRVRSLILVTPFLEASARLGSVLDAWCQVAHSGDDDTIAACIAPWLFAEELLADDDARQRTLRGLALMASRTPAASLRRQAAGLAAWSGTRRDSLAEIRVPTLVIAGAGDLLTPDAAEVAGAIPGARAVVIPRAGHGVTVEAGEAVSAAIREHLAGC